MFECIALCGARLLRWTKYNGMTGNTDSWKRFGVESGSIPPERKGMEVGLAGKWHQHRRRKLSIKIFIHYEQLIWSGRDKGKRNRRFVRRILFVTVTISFWLREGDEDDAGVGPELHQAGGTILHLWKKTLALNRNVDLQLNWRYLVFNGHCIPVIRGK